MLTAEDRARLRVYAITDATVTEARVRAWARGGVTALQLRDKTAAAPDILAAARRLAVWCRRERVLFFLNDHAEWQSEVGADGVHLGWSDAPDGARQRFSPGAVLGISAATPDQARRAAALGADYLGVGPIFATASKPGAGIGLDGLTAIRQAVPNLPIVAIGGITPATARQVFAAGADGVAAIAALRDTDDPTAAAAAFTTAWMQASKGARS